MVRRFRRVARRHLAPLILILLAVTGTARCSRTADPAVVEASAGGGAPSAEPGAYFVDVTQPLGIDFRHSIGDDHLSNIVETVGSGAAFVDFDGDGWVDLYVVNGANRAGISDGGNPSAATGARLYRNLQGGGYHDVTARAGVANAGNYGMGVAAADFDNDGYPDLFVCNYGLNVLYRNNGNGTFRDVASDAGVAGAQSDNSVGAVWLDFDNDGHLDLYVGNYLEYDPDYAYFYAPDGFPPPMAYHGQADRLYRNLGNGRFEDVTEAVGLYRPEGRMMGVGAADFDDDGFVDIYVSNDAMEDYLFRNVGGRRFEEVGFMAGVAFSIAGEETSSMAVDFGDVDGDGRLDLFVSDIHFSALYRNEGDGLFTDVTVASGVAEPSGQYDGWGAAFFDFDNDGDLDIFKANGAMNHLHGHEDQVFANDGSGRFTDVSLSLGSYFRREYVGRGAAIGDFDNDGNLDVFIVNLNDRPVLLRNQGLDRNNWLMLSLVGTNSNRDGIGARVRLTSGGRTQVAEKKSASGYLSTNDPRMHFGLGAEDVVERIEIRWPSGAVQVIENISARQVLVVEEPRDALARSEGRR